MPDPGSCRRPGGRLRPGTADDVDLADRGFDVAVIATAVPWFDLSVVLPELHRTLRPAGQLAVWRKAFGDRHARRRRAPLNVLERSASPTCTG